MSIHSAAQGEMILTSAGSNTSLFITMVPKREELPGLDDYSRSLSKKIAEYAGAEGKLTTIVCMTCAENFTPDFDGVNGITPCGHMRIWKFAYPDGGDIYIFIICYQCYMQQIMDQSKVLQTTAGMTEELSKSTEPAMKPHLYKEVIAIYGMDANDVVDLRDPCD